MVTEDELELAYMGGVFDGEGHIGVHSTGNDGYKRLVLQINITDKLITQLFHDRFGGSHTVRKQTAPHHKTQYHWRVSAKAARAAYEVLFPYLRLKRISDQPFPV